MGHQINDNRKARQTISRSRVTQGREREEGRWGRGYNYFAVAVWKARRDQGQRAEGHRMEKGHDRARKLID